MIPPEPFATFSQSSHFAKVLFQNGAASPEISKNTVFQGDDNPACFSCQAFYTSHHHMVIWSSFPQLNLGLGDSAFPASEMTKQLKSSRSPSSYRPISLVNTIYRLYATLLHQRLSAALEPHLSPQQFGFRRNRSMGSPLFIIGRLIEIFERHTTPLFVLFLDWSQSL